MPIIMDIILIQFLIGDNVQGYPPAGLVSGICACVAFFKYKDIIDWVVVPAGG
jgi:hypothetical protein